MKCLFAFLTVLVKISVQVQSCNKNDVEINGRCFQFNTEHIAFLNASKKCHSQGYHMASIHSADENSQIIAAAQKKFPVKDNYYYWLGLYDGPSGWTWEDGTKYDYHNWYSGFPDSNAYVLIRTDRTKWQTTAAIWKNAYLCSYYLDTTTTSTLRPTTTSSKLTTGSPTTTSTKLPTGSPTTTSTKVPTGSPTTTTTTTKTPTENSCDSDDVIINNRCYSFNRDMLSYEDSRNKCQKNGKTLAIFDNFNQINSVSSYANQKFQSTYGSFWIGLQRDNSSTQFYWQNGQSAIFTNWYSGYPYCGQLVTGQDISNTKWRTYPEDTQLYSVCSGVVS